MTAAAPAPATDPCAGCAALATTSAREIEELLRHHERLYDVLHEGRGEAAAESPIALIKLTAIRIKTVVEYVERREAERAAEEAADRKAVAEAARTINEHTNPGKAPR